MTFILRLVFLPVLLWAPSIHAEVSAKVGDAHLLATELCKTRSPCFIAKRTPWNDDTSRMTRELVYVVLDKKGAAWGQVPQWTNDGQFPECVPYEVWLMQRKGKSPQTFRLLAEVCNDGYGARNLGQDTFEFKLDGVAYRQSGGSNWGWSHGAIFNPNTLQFEKSEKAGWFSGGRQQDRTRWEWSTLRGETRWYVDQCDWYRTGKGEGETVAEGSFYRYRNIPQPVLPTQYEKEHWQSGTLSGCALNVDSAGTNGYVVTGKPGVPTDAEFDVLAVDERTVIVDVRDDAFVTSSKSWVYGDHLEVWLAPRMSVSHCLDEVKPPKQWGIRMSDGAVFAAHGNPKENIGVERIQTAEGSLRFKLSLPENLPTFTLVYSDSDDGVTQKRLIATSLFTFAQSATMGRVGTPIKPKFGQCVMQGTSLVFERTEHKASTRTPVFAR